MTASEGGILTGYWDGVSAEPETRLLPAPGLEGPKDVLVEVRAAMFGAALVRALTQGHHRLRGPRVLGSLVAGRVREAGSRSHLSPGDRVVVDPHPPCGACDLCATVPALCAKAPRLDPGGMSELVALHGALADACHVIPDAVPYKSAVLTEILACVMEAFDVSGVDEGTRLTVIGAGPAGLMAVQLAARVCSARPLVVVNRQDRGDLASSFGADVVMASDDLQDVFGGADVVIECVGTGKTYQLATRLAAPGATVVAFGGMPAGTTVDMDVNDVHYRALTLVGSYHYRPGSFGRALKLLGEGEVDLDSLVTHTLPLERVGEACSVASSPECVGLVVEPVPNSATNAPSPGNRTEK